MGNRSGKASLNKKGKKDSGTGNGSGSVPSAPEQVEQVPAEAAIKSEPKAQEVQVTFPTFIRRNIPEVWKFL